MSTKIFIDGAHGTTGLRIQDRLAARRDIELLILDDDKRKIDAYRKEAINSCDIAFLCLPDAASIQAVSMIENDDVKVIDTSTAHRTSEEWLYGFPELCENGMEAFASAKRVAVPGCHASGFISTVAPLVREGIVESAAALSCFSITGYSGGGKQMIAEYQSECRDGKFDAPRQYGASQQHKHLPEMKAVCGLKSAPAFSPVVCDFYSGMLVNVFLNANQLRAGRSFEDARECLETLYKGPVVNFVDIADGNGFVDSNAMTGKDGMQVGICGSDEVVTLVSRFDNLGKGASGAAIQCMNLMMGIDMTKGLEL